MYRELFLRIFFPILLSFYKNKEERNYKDFKLNFSMTKTIR